MRKVIDGFCILCFLGVSIGSLIYAKELSQYALRALKMCAHVFIPSLFPFLVLARLGLTTGVSKRIGNALSPVLSPLFGLRPELCGELLIGLLGGFPNGALAVKEAYRKGLCTKSEAEYLCAIANNASFGFVTATAGVYALGSAKAGLLLLTAECVTIVLQAFLLRLWFPVKKGSLRACTPSTGSLNTAICTSVRGSVDSMLSICGYVIVFYTLSELCSKGPSENVVLTGIIKGLCELSSGVMACAELAFPQNYILCAACLGFSGLCVWLQVSEIALAQGLSLKPFLFTRLCGMVLLPVVTSLLLLCLPVRTIGVSAPGVVMRSLRFYPVKTVYVVFLIFVIWKLALFTKAEKTVLSPLDNDKAFRYRRK